MDHPALIKLPDGNWIDPALVSSVVGGGMDTIQVGDTRLSGITITCLVTGQAFKQCHETPALAQKVRDKIAHDILDALNPYRSQSDGEEP